MARRIADPKIDTRTARSKLPQRREPYWCSLSGGLALGYRKGSKGGHWVAKHYSAAQGRRYSAIGPADDTLDDGVLGYDEAQEAARDWLADLGEIPRKTRPGAPYTVSKAIQDYVEHLRLDGRTEAALHDIRQRADKHIIPVFGETEVAALEYDDLRKWRDELARRPSEWRGGSAKANNTRQRRASVNRIWTIFRAALNLAFQENRRSVPSDSAWRGLKPFADVDAARVRYLTRDEARRLINAADAELRPIVLAALHTGGRYGQLARLVASDVDRDAGTVRMQTRKGGGSVSTYHVILTDEGRRFFQAASAGKTARENLFVRDDGTEWAKSDTRRPIRAASERAKIDPPVSYNVLRHTWASLSVMAGMPLMVVARNMGHADTRMVEKHYGHLAPSYVADAVRAHAPKFGIYVGDKKVLRAVG